MEPKNIPTINRDISWLSFNERVLQEAQNKNVPLIERMHFLGIYSNNLDEFFRVRVATLRRLSSLLRNNNSDIAKKNNEVLSQIQDKVINLQKAFHATYHEILTELRIEGISILDETEIDEQQQEIVKEYYIDQVEAYVNPIIINNLRKFPYLRDKSVYLFCILTKQNDKKVYALIELPTEDISRFFVLPDRNAHSYIIYLDDVIRYNMPNIFSIFEPENIESYIIKLTRDAELDLDDDISESYYERIMKSVDQRKKGKLVRFVHDKEIPQFYLDYILKSVKLNKKDNIIPGGRYHNFRDFMGFPDLNNPDLCFPKLNTITHPYLVPNKSILKQIEDRDVLLQFPYHSFDYIIDLVREAAIDPKVVSIKISLYRLAQNSKIIKALKNAARNGKHVDVIIELRARFDEKANLNWSKQLQEENINVDFGFKGLKVHSKLLLIQKRKSKDELSNYAFISTGNFHEDTAKIYCDTALLTSYKPIVDEVETVFQLFSKPYIPYKFEHLLVAPADLRTRVNKLIDDEISNAKADKEAFMFLKVNNIVDEDIIKRLYEASNAGVNQKIIARGVCSMVPGVEGFSENIEIRSIVGRFLEHSRVFWFCSNGENKIYIGSADLMTRNLDARIEVLTPIYDPTLRNELMDYLLLQWSDNSKARVIDQNMENNFFHNSEAPLNAQMQMFNALNATTTVMGDHQVDQEA